MTAPTETVTPERPADPLKFIAPGGPHVIALVNGKGGQGKSTLAMGLAARAAQLDLDTVALDVDPQASTFDTAQAMGETCPYRAVHETDPLQVARIREVTGPRRIYVDTPGNLERLDVLAEVLTAVDLVVVPYDASPIAKAPTFRTLGLLAAAGVPHRVLLNNIPGSHSAAMMLEHWQALDAAVFCTRCGIDQLCAGGCDLRRGARAFGPFIRSYMAWQRTIDAKLPITAYRSREEYASRVRGDLASAFLAIELELAKPRSER